jgi:two-component system phosphate regulon sensor histidine kinase PhoR
MIAKKPLTKIALILFLIILLPAIFFSAYELSSLNANENVIQSIFNNQLDAILFSVNQYSHDIVSSWTAKLNLAMVEKQIDEIEFSKGINRFLNTNPAINAIFITDSISKKDINIFTSQTSNANQFHQNDAVRILNANENNIIRLFQYKKEAGYLKFETAYDSILGNSSIIMFLSTLGFGKTKTNFVIFNPNIFISQILAPKIQNVSQDKFIISIYNNNNNQITYSTEETELTKLEQKKPLWLLPNYSLGISLKGETIAGLVKARSKFNITLIILLNLVLLAGLWFVYKSVRKEIELAQIKSDFVSNVSHELRTPLALISMFAETLELGRAKTEEKKNEYYRIISQEANRLSKIVNKILNFSKIEAGKIKYHFEETDLNNVVNNIFTTYCFHLQSNGFKCSLQLEDNIGSINADKEALSEAIVNLLDNAVKYSKENKDISVETGRDHETAYVEIRDKGIGISKEDQNKIFDKFYRVTSGNIQNTRGTGLGLSLVKHIIEAHKGKITIDSSPGKGSSFKLYFPLMQAKKS